MASHSRTAFLPVVALSVLAACSGAATSMDPPAPAEDLTADGGPASAADATSPPPSASAAAPASDPVAVSDDAPLATKEWRKAIATTPRPKDEGCFTATAPGMTWNEVPCGKVPDGLMYRAARGNSGHAALELAGLGNDFVATVSGTISWAEGSFPSVTNVTSETSVDGGNPGYSLQLNSNYFSTPKCSGAAAPSGCSGWEQFLYAPDLGVFIQSWLLSYNNDNKTCPTGWKSDKAADCYLNSPMIAVPSQPITSLSKMALTGTAGAYDSAFLYVGNSIYSSSVANPLTLSAGWKWAEFNVVGNAGGGEAVFNSNASIVVQTLTDSVTPTTTAPSCSVGGWTAETNNLNLGSCCAVGGDTPGIQFTESNAASPSTPSCPLEPVASNWTTVPHPFDGVVAGFDKDGTLLTVCRGSTTGASLQVGKGRPNWNYCDIGLNGVESKVAPYETLVAEWVDDANGAVPSNALALGTDGSGGPTLFACRAFINGLGYQVGKTRPGISFCDIPHAGAELHAPRYQVLTNRLPLQVASVNGTGVSYAAIVGGYDNDNTPLYVCVASVNGGLAPGSMRAGATACNVSFGGTVHTVSAYSYLVPQFKTSGSGFLAGVDIDDGILGVCNAAFNDGTSTGFNSFQVGRFVGEEGTCNFGYAGKEEIIPSGSFSYLSF